MITVCWWPGPGNMHGWLNSELQLVVVSRKSPALFSRELFNCNNVYTHAGALSGVSGGLQHRKPGSAPGRGACALSGSDGPI